MDSTRWMLALCFLSSSVFRLGETVGTTESLKYTCKTYGSGVIQAFGGSTFYVRSNCPFTFARFTHNRVECDITIRRGQNGLLNLMEIIINKVKTVVQNGTILVEKKRVSLPYDHTYQHIFQYGIYTRLRSSLLPLSVTWHTAAGGVDNVWVELDQELSSDLSGLCAIKNSAGNIQELIRKCLISDTTCHIQDLKPRINPLCRQFFSHAVDCLTFRTAQYINLCDENIYSFEGSSNIMCAFFKEITLLCGKRSHIWDSWRTIANCAPPTCPGDLIYIEEGPPFVPSCSNPDPRLSSLETTSTCVCPADEVLNDHAVVQKCVGLSSCPCVFIDQIYSPGDIRTTKCQTCQCDNGRWQCSENSCPARCLIEGQFVTTYDGKQYAVPGKCTYMASQGVNWSIKIEFSTTEASLKAVHVQLFQEIYTFTLSKVKVGERDITELYQSDLVLIFWQSSMYVEVYTVLGLKLQVQVFPEIQLSIMLPTEYTGLISGLCGNRNNDTTDDFSTSSGIIESSAKLFALSWSLGDCSENIPNPCINTDNEIFADEKCSVLNDPNGIFAKCHAYIPTDQYHTACIQRTCNCGNNLLQCLCGSLGSYAKACAILGVELGDWRKAANCTLICPKNQEFSYNVRACNNTCLSLSGHDPRCELEYSPTEGCGCPEGTYLNQEDICTPGGQCMCYYSGGMTPPGPVIIDGQQCLCENGKLHCSKDCGCTNGKICVHCSEFAENTAQKTCNSLSKPLSANVTCESGCYCPDDQYEDHFGRCVSRNNCTCMFSGQVFSAGEQVKSNCKTCTCIDGQWKCKDEACSGKCQVYGNGHYQTFDSKWYRFDGHCQYTLVEDYCGHRNGSFSVRVESVPCCDEALTCSRTIILDLEDKVSLTLSDMKVTRQLHSGWTLEKEPLYTTHTMGLYIIVSVPSKGLALIWDKHTRITIELHPYWRNKVCGLCGNFDSSELNDLQISGSDVVSSPLAFGNIWKTTTPPCLDVTTEIFPCERNSYCSAWAQRRCMILKGDTFKDCHLKVDPEPYYHACVQESCSCEFEGKFLGFCTAVAAYAEACSAQDVCINWRTPDLCPVYCDYYNEQGQCRWHYEACGRMLTCGKANYFLHKLEGCYPKCPKETPYFDENTARCTELRNCSCLFNETIVPPGEEVIINFVWCTCENGTFICPPIVTPTVSSETTATSPAETTIRLTTPTTLTTTSVFTTMETLLTSTPMKGTTASFDPTLPTTSFTPTSSSSTAGSTVSKPVTTTSSSTTVGSTVSKPVTTTSSSTTVGSTVSKPVTTTSSSTTVGSTVSKPVTTTSLSTTVGSTFSTLATTTSSSTTAGNTLSTLATTTSSSTTVGSAVSKRATATSSSSAAGSTFSTPTTASSSSTTVASTFSTLATATSSTPTAGSQVSTPAATTSSSSTVGSTVSTSAPTTSNTTIGSTVSTPTNTTSSPKTSTEFTTLTSSNALTSVSTEKSTTLDIITGSQIQITTRSLKANTTACFCRDLKLGKIWACGDTWTDDCFVKRCVDGTIELTPVVCPEPIIPECPRNRLIKIKDGCCETWKCDCRCELYGDPHYISFSGVTFDFLENCSYILVEERSPRYHLTILVDTFYCVPGLQGSCVKDVIVKYQNNTAELSIDNQAGVVQATLNNEIVEPPYEENGISFETTNYKVFIYLPEIRSYVSLSPSFNLVVNLAMEHFVNNTQGQCGECGGASCIRRGGQIESDTCCDKTAYDWVYYDPLQLACFSAPVNVSCHEPSPEPTGPTPTCSPNPLCQLLEHPVFANCSKDVDMNIKKKNCEFDSCNNPNASCFTLEQFAQECCIDWRELTNGSCDVKCPKGLIYHECRDKKDDFCFGGVIRSGADLEKTSSGCFCPPGLIRAGRHSDICVKECTDCKGPLGEPKFPGDVWESDCHVCTCNNQTLTEECFPKPVLPTPVCPPYAILVNTTCCGDPVCVNKTCSYLGVTYNLGDTWKDATDPCMSFICTEEGIQSESRICLTETCPEGNRIWNDKGCCFTCNQACAPKLTKMNVTIDDCSTSIEVPVCEGQCLSEPWVLVHDYLQVKQYYRCCQEESSEFRVLDVECSDLTTRRYNYNHVTSCECSACVSH